MEISGNPNLRLDDLQIKGYHIYQDPSRFCFGMDAVLLSEFAKVKKSEVALDLCTGNGIVPILLEAKTQGLHFSGLEIQEESANLAKASVEYNGLQNKVKIVTGDIKEAERYFDTASFHVVTVNPPYMVGNHGLRNDMDCKTIARHEVLCDLEDVVRCGARLLKGKGRFYMVHRPFRLVEIFTCMTKYNLEPKRIRFVHPYVDKEPNMVLIEGLKDGRSRVEIEPPLIVYNKDGSYTEELLRWYGKKVEV